ncbi:hypothetical protein L207DRAFT_20655 [Hyaloscypha variabilis F]|uniref:Uncharacterized protein n=1 Tax=Hyaloscypha variabilis (strain UAMH 11265 / GT02V1 / F) TaxID=1149755 RepID=A0A2J6SE67_HYAVF|nr:hypothetical protein L207DRAFT_20655 [Hyaloscypha variabilis F]
MLLETWPSRAPQCGVKAPNTAPLRQHLPPRPPAISPNPQYGNTKRHRYLPYLLAASPLTCIIRLRKHAPAATPSTSPILESRAKDKPLTKTMPAPWQSHASMCIIRFYQHQFSPATLRPLYLVAPQ